MLFEKEGLSDKCLSPISSLIYAYKWDPKELPKTKAFLLLFLGNVNLVCLVV